MVHKNDENIEQAGKDLSVVVLLHLNVVIE